MLAMRFALLAATAVTVSAIPVAAHAQSSQDASLRGIRDISVLVTPAVGGMDRLSADTGALKTNLKTAVEDELRRAGLTVLPAVRGDTTQWGEGLLIVDVLLTSPANYSQYVYRYGLTLKQQAHLPASGLTQWVTTWQTGSVANAPAAQRELEAAVWTNVGAALSRFTAALKAANGG